MSLYRVGDPFGGGRDDGGDGLSDEERALLAVLMGDHENDKLYQIMCNYLALAQFELARSVLDELFTLAPERVVHVLRTLVLIPRPQKWLYSEQVPTGAHLAWLAYMEYKYNCKMVPRAREPDLFPDSETRSAWLKLLANYEKTPVNPLGFVSHDRFQITIVEGSTLKVFERQEYAPRPPLSFRVSFEFEGKKHSTKECATTEVLDPRWNSSFTPLPIDIYFADSNIQFSVFARRVLRDRHDESEEELIGIAELPLYQLRQKEDYHIWLPLEPPEPDDIENPFNLPKQRGVGLSQVARPNYGKIRIRSRWLQAGVETGEMPPRITQPLEMDLLVSEAVYNGHGAFHAAQRGFTAGMSLKVPPTGLLRGRNENVGISGELIPDNSPVLSQNTVTALRKYVAQLVSDVSDDNELALFAQNRQHPDTYLVRNTIDIYPQLRQLMWRLPVAAHALCAKIRYLENSSPINKRYQLSTLPGPTKMESLYAQVIVEMLIKKEFSRAVMAGYHFVHDIYPHPKRHEPIDIALNAFLAFVHDSYQDVETLQQTLNQLLHQANVRKLERGGEESVVELGIEIDESWFKDDKMELHQFSNEYTVRKYHETLLMRAQVYSALLGTPHEFTLRRFCSLEDQYLHGTPVAKNQLPPCFAALKRALDALHKVADTLTVSQLEAQQHQCLVTFYGAYLSYIRVTNQHIFEYPVKKALGYCKGRDFGHANLALLPFSELRPLVVLLAWDEFEDEYYARENLIVEVWRKRPIYPNEACHEPRLIEWCNRLDFNVMLITAVLDYIDKRNGVTLPLSPAQVDDRNDKAIRLLDTLRLHSLLYAFRDYLSDVSPTVLIDALSDKVPVDRGLECDHDIHVLRSYYAIHGVMGTILKSLTDPVVENPAQIDTFFSVDPEAALLEDTQHAEGNGEVRAANSSSAEGGMGMIPSNDDARPRLTVLKASQRHLLSMNKAEFQVTTLEKMFCLVFMQEEDIIEDETGNSSTMVSLKRTTANESDNNNDDQDESPLVLNDTDMLIAYLKFLLNSAIKVSAAMSSDHKRNPSPRDATDMARVEAIKLHVNETLWRLNVLKEKGLPPSLSLLSAPMESISSVFLKMDANQIDAPLRQPNHLGNQMIAERWRQLCSLVRERARTRPRYIVNGVIDFIDNFYKDPEVIAMSNDGSGASTLQGFFFAMDVMIVFNHLLNPQQVQELVEFALSFLQATKSSHETPEAIDLFDFFVAYTKHCRFHNRRRFELKGVYDLAIEDGTHDIVEEENMMNVLTVWVQAYRLSLQAKISSRSDVETSLQNGWLTSESGRPEDEITARTYPQYVQAYQEYCNELGISQISEALVDTDGNLLQPSDNIYRSPWNGFEVLQFLTKIAVGARHDHDVMKAEWEKQEREKEREALMEAARRRRNNRRGSGDDDDDDDYDNDDDDIPKKKTPEEEQAEIQERLEVVSQRMAVLGRLLLPSLAALRYSLRFAPESAIPMIGKFAREQSALFPSYARFVDWRVSVYEKALRLVVDVDDGGGALSQDIRSLFSMEDVAHDQQAYMKLLAAFLTNEHLSVAQKKVALEMADFAVNADADATREAESQIQALLLSLIDDETLEEHSIRAKCILRLKDIVWATQMTLKYIDEWTDVDMCVRVLLKCVSDLNAAHPLRPKVAVKYNIVLIFQQISSSLSADDLQAFMTEYRKAHNVSSKDRVSIQRIFHSWQSFERECRANVGFVILRLLDTKQIQPAQMLFELYKKGKALSGEGFGMSMDAATEADIEERIEAALIAQLFAPDPLTGLPNAPAKKRIEAMNRLNKVANKKKFRVCRHMIDSLPGAQARFIIVEYLRVFVRAHDDAREVRAELERERREGVVWDDYALGEADDETLELMAELDEVDAELGELLSTKLSEDDRILRTEMEKRLQVVRSSLETHREELRRERLKSLPPAELAKVEEKSKKRLAARKIKEIIEFEPQVRQWLVVMNTSVRILMTVPFVERKPFEQLYRNPKELVIALLNKGKIRAFPKIMRIFREYDGSVLNPDGVAVSETMAPTDAERERGVIAGPFNPYGFILRFAEQVLTLQRHDMGKDVGFQLFDLCTMDGEYLVVADKCLDIVNGLSSRLADHDHALFLVHLMKNILTYFKVKLEPRLRDQVGFRNVFTRYQEYRNIVFTRDELRKQVDPTSGVASKKLPLIYALRRVQFCIDDLRDKLRARRLRERLIQLDKGDLARRVWEECEMDGGGGDVDGEARDEFERDLARQMDEVRTMCEQFDSLPSQHVKRKTAHVVGRDAQ